ncbi:hypothetical protein M569_03815, partial [Genlisea aurea]
KLSSRYDFDKDHRVGSYHVVGEESCLKNDLSNFKSHGSEYFPSNRLKRHIDDSDSVNRKHQADHEEHPSSKNRRLSNDGSVASFSSDHHSSRVLEKPYKSHAATSSRSTHSEKHSTRFVEPSKGGHDRHNYSPHHSERSPRDYCDRSSPVFHETSHDQRRHRDRSRSPYHRARRHDNRYRSSSHVERSPPEHGRNCDGRERTPAFSDRSPQERGQYGREANWKSGAGEKRHIHGSRGVGTKSKGRESRIISEELPDKGNVENRITSKDKVTGQPCQQVLVSGNSAFNGIDCPMESETIEESASMEVDMEICNTPPHISSAADTAAGKWYYLDHFGMERGPASLSDLKILMEEGYLASDHLIKHSDSDRWVSVEKAVSPLVSGNFISIVPDTISQLASPPEAPGNLLADSGNLLLSDDDILGSFHPISFSDDHVFTSKSVEDFRIDDRVADLLRGVALIAGQEVEMLADVLLLESEQWDLERWQFMEEQISEKSESRSAVLFSSEIDSSLACSNTCESFIGEWACKGCDWMRNDEATQEQTWKRKFVLNDGYPLCQMPKSGCEDPRWAQKDDLYFPSESKKLDLAPWAYNNIEDLNDPTCTTKSINNRSAIARGVRGLMHPVIRINACVVNDLGSLVSESRAKVRGKEKFSMRSSWPHLASGDSKKLPKDGLLKISYEKEANNSQEKCASFVAERDHLCKVDELNLQFGGWYYLDGAGHERGPLAFSELQVMAQQGVIQNLSSVYRKTDNVWIPVFVPSENFEIEKNVNSCSSLLEASTVQLTGYLKTASNFHELHPQFIGYTRGKLHELVMKSYKSREFAAAINEVLDPWISARQPKKETEKFIYSSDHFHPGKVERIHGFDDGHELEDDSLTSCYSSCGFDELCANVTFPKGEEMGLEFDGCCWGMLDGQLLARVLHFLRGDAKSLFYASLTCKHWRSVVMLYKGICRQIDFGSTASVCSDLVVMKIMSDFNKENVTSLLLRGCTAITYATLEKLLQLFPSLSTIDIRGCSQFEDLVCKFPNINWVRNRGSQLKLRGLNHLSSGQIDDSSGLREYLESSGRRDTANQLFRRSLYKRSKLFDARKSSSILSRDAQLRYLAIKKSGNAYKKLEEYIATSLRDIMRENSFEFFRTKVSAIEERMKNGYYARRGLKCVKDDISSICQEAIKKKSWADSRDKNRVVMLFLRLVTALDEASKLDYKRDDVRSSKADSPPGFSSVYSRYRKNMSKVLEKKQLYRSNGSLFSNGSFDSGDYVSDREIKRRLSRFKKSLNSESDTSDEFSKSSDASRVDSESSASATESDIESPSEVVVGEPRGETLFASDDGFDSVADEREWGARMTEASLVPPVTRKYEDIDRYIIVDDEQEVRRKMQVSLPEDYAEKLAAQRNGNEESDMEIPEVKDYRPRKSLGYEVIEQEVYGIDPYTHNLLLDSMPDESDWSLVDKHLFIEKVLLRTLNKQAREFTGSGSTPMMYPLKSVLEEILESAHENNDRRMMHLCQFMIKAIDSRPEDNYVAYRKGLGVVCNKEGGFSEDDFIVEFLGEVYPTWKWFEKQDGIRALQRNNKDPVPEFYNIYLERPKGDADGYDLVVVDAMHKANYASRICHSCRPNCEAKVTAVDGQYQIGIYSVRPIAFGEEVTFDYNSVTESKEEYEASVCLCGNQVCRGSYLNLTGEGAFLKVLKEHHGLLDRHCLLLEACELNTASEEDYIDLGKAGLGSCLLGGLPDWLIAYVARLVRFINFERTILPNEILKHNIEEKKKFFAEINMEVEKSDAEIQAEGVYNQRLQNLALTIDKVRYVMRCVFGDPKRAAPPLERLTAEDTASYFWKSEGSFVEELTHFLAPHMDESALRDLKAKINAHDPSGSYDTEMKLQKSLLWLRDEVRNLPCTYKSRHDAAADLIHIYAHTKCFLRIREYKPVTSSPVHITPHDLGPKYANKLGSSGVHEYCKTYSGKYCLGQLMFWYNQHAEPDAILAKASRGCLSLPDMGSFYPKVQKPSRQHVYGPKTVKFMVSKMEKQPQRAWPKDRIWSFKNSTRVIGSPMFDTLLYKAPLDRDMVHWLKHRPSVYEAVWDR